MGVTTIKDGEGNLLWQANDFGKYSNMKTGAIAEILSELLQDITLKVDTHISGEDITDVYTKAESDARFVQLVIFPSYLEAQVDKLIMEGKILGVDTVDLINQRLLLLYKSCFGTDLEGHRVQTGFDVRIQDLEDASDFVYNRVIRISRDIYKINGGEVDINVLVVAKVEDTGKKSDLSNDIADTSTMVAAINSVNTKINTSVSSLSNKITALETQNGSETLDTVKSTLSGAVNEINSNVSDISSDIGNMNNLDSRFTDNDIVSALNQLMSTVSDLSQSISSLESRVSALEGN